MQIKCWASTPRGLCRQSESELASDVVCEIYVFIKHLKCYFHLGLELELDSMLVVPFCLSEV